MRTALVTGGTSGIGLAFARALAARGHHLVLVARDADRLEEIAAGLRTEVRSVEVLRADLADRADVQLVVDRLSDPDRPIDVLVNNAGFGVHWSLVSDELETWDRAYEVMVRSVLVLAGAAARAMKPRGFGTIINVSSVAGYITMGAYSSIKAWVTSYSESLSNELKGTGITVTALLPGWVRTEFHGRARIKSSSIPSALWLDSEPLVDACLRDVDRGRVLSIPTIRFQVLTWLLRHLPRKLVRSVSRAISSSRRDSLNQ
ncbi:SDR family NAD(P)-dependent oxidoreductase [Naasia lichenicola]|uniref:SDR family NAD(P)-dependent oxidoreductase n=1 Tax=Naasia lichenicola TaxID=2565933 RepID=A0A4S4FP72_9MICO|nr:SDR family NAD(P)-dependent oxidoreductase [Naasia lichenicola]THG32329.1 SDR family NAD(P)-dependent oxidoreductase [Naasia lichenicola]